MLPKAEWKHRRMCFSSGKSRFMSAVPLRMLWMVMFSGDEGDLMTGSGFALLWPSCAAGAPVITALWPLSLQGCVDTGVLVAKAAPRAMASCCPRAPLEVRRTGYL